MSRGNVTPIRYYFDCCTVPADRVIKKAGQKIRCPDHPKTSTYLSVDCACQVCGETTNGRTVKMYCEPCRVEVDKKNKKEYFAKYNRDEPKRKLKKSGSQTKYRNKHLCDPERSDCRFRLLICVEKYNNYDTIPCKGCKRYIQQMGNVDPLYTKE